MKHNKSLIIVIEYRPHSMSAVEYIGFQSIFFYLGRVKELGPESNAKKKAAPADGGEDESPDEMSSLSDGRHINNVDLALLCNHSVSV